MLIDYLYRWFNETQHQFTPKEQVDLNNWDKMITLNYYPSISTQAQLDSLAPTLLQSYKKANAVILQTHKITRVNSGKVEYIITVPRFHQWFLKKINYLA